MTLIKEFLSKKTMKSKHLKSDAKSLKNSFTSKSKWMLSLRRIRRKCLNLKYRFDRRMMNWRKNEKMWSDCKVNFNQIKNFKNIIPMINQESHLLWLKKKTKDLKCQSKRSKKQELNSQKTLWSLKQDWGHQKMRSSSLNKIGIN